MRPGIVGPTGRRRGSGCRSSPKCSSTVPWRSASSGTRRAFIGKPGKEAPRRCRVCRSSTSPRFIRRSSFTPTGKTPNPRPGRSWTSSSPANGSPPGSCIGSDGAATRSDRLPRQGFDLGPDGRRDPLSPEHLRGAGRLRLEEQVLQAPEILEHLEVSEGGQDSGQHVETTQGLLVVVEPPVRSPGGFEGAQRSAGQRRQLGQEGPMKLGKPTSAFFK